MYSVECCSFLNLSTTLVLTCDLFVCYSSNRFSLTKWIHLHNGDEGLKMFFKKIYRSLNPGGIFLMEPQAYNTYKKRSKLTKTIEAHYKVIKFMPDQFESYLLSSEVGFREVQHLGQSQGKAQNFNRPIILFRK